MIWYAYLQVFLSWAYCFIRLNTVPGSGFKVIFFYNLCRVACRYTILRYILCYHAAGTNYSMFANSNTGRNNTVGTYPNIVANGNLLGYHILLAWRQCNILKPMVKAR